MEIKAVRIGNRYGPEFEIYLRGKLPNIQFLNENKNGLFLQWNKINFFAEPSPGPVCVIDIDVLLINDYMELFNYPIERGEFLSIRQWWDPNSKTELNGGFYKFYPEDTQYIFDKMMEDPKYWMMYFVKNGTKPGPINGEENFVEMMVKEKLKLKFVPDKWANRNTKADYNSKDLKLIHYTGLANYVDHSKLISKL